jgi:hypothetical protein
MAKPPPSFFAFISDELLGEIARAALDKAGPEDDPAAVVTAAMQKVIENATPEMAASLLRDAKSIVRRKRDGDAGFERHNCKRWKQSFARIDLVWSVAEEIGRAFNDRFRPDAVAGNDLVFEALTRAHGRGLLVAGEAINLMKGGYAEGALSRWRTLHEILVITMFIRKHGRDIAERYLLSAHFRSLEAAEQLNKFAERANLGRFSDEEIDRFKATCANVAGRLGQEMYAEFGWARAALTQRGDKWKPRLEDLEASLGLDHWRPRYKWASQHTHAGHRHAHASLGLVESQSDLILVGQSNSGMVDPLQLVAGHLWSLTATLLLSRESAETLILSNLLQYLADDVARLALDDEKTSLEKARKKHRTG